MKPIFFPFKYLIFLLIFIFYAYFPTNNSSLDAYAYAGYVKYNHFLFTPHHLFSNVLIFLLIKPFSYLGFNLEILHFSKLINSCFQLINLIVFYKILGLLKINEKRRLLFILLIGFSFSLWRYGTENETYIVPITFSLLGSYCYIKSNSYFSNKTVFLGSFFGVIACLFHQIHFFWWLGLLFGFYFLNRKKGVIFWYLLPSILVPLAYILVLVFYEKQDLTLNNLQYFVLHDFYQGTVDSDFGWKGFFFQILNTIRTYIQVHPNIYVLIKHNWLYVIPLFICGLIGIKIGIDFYKKEQLILRKMSYEKNIILIHGFIFGANYLFAFYNTGNIEFMVMLPFLLVLCLILRYDFKENFLLLMVTLFFTWNFFYAIYPNNSYQYYNDDELIDYMVQNKDKGFIVKNTEVLNHYYYKTGISSPRNIKSYHYTNQEDIDLLLKKYNNVYTDVLGKPQILNKESMTLNKLSFEAKDYNLKEVFSYKGLYGESTVYHVEKK